VYDEQEYQWNMLAHNKEFMRYANAHVGPESSLGPQDTNRCRNPPPLPYQSAHPSAPLKRSEDQYGGQHNVYSPPDKECPLAPLATQGAHTILAVQTRIWC